MRRLPTVPDSGFANGRRTYVLPGLAFTRVDVDRSECQASGIVSVASSVRTRADHDSMVPYEGLLRILS